MSLPSNAAGVASLPKPTLAGRPSQSCDSCRARRIKCDRSKGGCSQCRRVNKQCSGYRDLLSLMFRDESSKVIRRAQGRTPSFPATASTHQVGRPLPREDPNSIDLTRHTLTVRQRQEGEVESKDGMVEVIDERAFPLFQQVGSTKEQLGKDFYLRRYLVGHPGEPDSMDKLATKAWHHDPSLQDFMIAVGLAGLSNLNQDADTRNVALQKHGRALRQMRHTVALLPLSMTLRSIILLAQFEVSQDTDLDDNGLSPLLSILVKLVWGTPHNTGVANSNTHVTGALDLMQRRHMVAPTVPGPNIPDLAGFMDLLFCTFIPSFEEGRAPSDKFFGMVALCRLMVTEPDTPLPELAFLISRFLQVAASYRSHLFKDDRSKTFDAIQELLGLEDGFDNWEKRLQGKWVLRTIDNQGPPEAVFKSRLHAHPTTAIARAWNHYRWARILLNQMILQFRAQYPKSAMLLIAEDTRGRSLAIIKTMAQGILISTPCHFRHPLLDSDSKAIVDSEGQPGAGSAGIAPLLFHLQVAGCAPGVPIEYWEWSFATLRTIWGVMGMLTVRNIMDRMEAYKEKNLYSAQIAAE